MNFYVYLFECVPVGIHKIGYARDPEKRMKKLERKALGPCRYVYGIPWGVDDVEPWQTASCQPYRLLWCAPAEDHRAAERTLHKHFADKRIEVENWPQCEWFNLDADDIDYICSIERFKGGTAIVGQDE